MAARHNWTYDQTKAQDPQFLLYLDAYYEARASQTSGTSRDARLNRHRQKVGSLHQTMHALTDRSTRRTR